MMEVSDLKFAILKKLPGVVQHQAECKSKSKPCQLNGMLLQYFIQKEFFSKQSEEKEKEADP